MENLLSYACKEMHMKGGDTMEKGSFWIERKQDGRTSIGIEDYDVEYFGRMDHEMIYTLDAENLKLFYEKAFRKTQWHSGTDDRRRIRDPSRSEEHQHVDGKLRDKV